MCRGTQRGRWSPVLKDFTLLLFTDTQHLDCFPQAKMLIEQGQRGRVTTPVACISTLSKTGGVCWNLMQRLLCSQSTSNSVYCQKKNKLCKSNKQGRSPGRYSYPMASWTVSSAPQNFLGDAVTGPAISHRFVQPECLHRKGQRPLPQQMKQPKNRGTEGRSPPSPPYST